MLQKVRLLSPKKSQCMLIPAHSSLQLSPGGLPRSHQEAYCPSPGVLSPRFSWTISPCSKAVPTANLRGPCPGHTKGCRVGSRQQPRSQAGIWSFRPLRESATQGVENYQVCLDRSSIVQSLIDNEVKLAFLRFHYQSGYRHG